MTKNLRRKPKSHPRAPAAASTSAMRRESSARVREELLDVAVVAIRWWEQLGAA